MNSKNLKLSTHPAFLFHGQNLCAEPLPFNTSTRCAEPLAASRSTPPVPSPLPEHLPWPARGWPGHRRSRPRVPQRHAGVRASGGSMLGAPERWTGGAGPSSWYEEVGRNERLSSFSHKKVFTVLYVCCQCMGIHHSIKKVQYQGARLLIFLPSRACNQPNSRMVFNLSRRTQKTGINLGII